MKYIVQGTITVSCHTVVEADTPEEAIAEAEDRPVAGLCFRPFDAGAEDAWHIDTDGSPYELRAEEDGA